MKLSQFNLKQTKKNSKKPLSAQCNASYQQMLQNKSTTTKNKIYVDNHFILKGKTTGWTLININSISISSQVYMHIGYNFLFRVFCV